MAGGEAEAPPEASTAEGDLVSGGVHTIWIPAGWSVEQVWEAIKRGEGDQIIAKLDVSATDVGFWANVDDAGRLVEPPSE